MVRLEIVAPPPPCYATGMATLVTPVAPRRPIIGYLLAASGAVMFASKGVIIKLAYDEGVDAITLLTLRMMMAAPVFILVGILTSGSRSSIGRMSLDARVVLTTIGTGLLGYWYASYADFKGLETLSAQFERLILFTYPLFVVLIGAAFFGHRIRWRALAAFGLSYSGLAVVFLHDLTQHGSGIAIGTIWVLSSAVAFAVYQLLAKPLIGRLGAAMFTAIAMAGAAAGVFVQFLLTHPLSALMVSPRAFLITAALALLATILPTYLMNAALSKISAAANATIGTLSPVATLALAAMVLGEAITAADLAGTLLVLVGIGLYTAMDRRS